jgi:hypothetical protein
MAISKVMGVSFGLRAAPDILLFLGWMTLSAGEKSIKQ